MKISIRLAAQSLKLFAILWWLLSSGCNPASDKTLDPGEFRNPPEPAKIYSWWHWMERSITRQGITRDLEAMKSQGVIGATILNVGLIEREDHGVPKVVFASPEWFDMYKWALQEANRLGMVIGVHNCDGWSTSGGPWISPEMSMKDLTWNKTIVTGGRLVDTVILRPNHLMDFYKDIALVAYPSEEQLNTFQAARPVVRINNNDAGNILFDGNPGSFVRISDEATVDITFPAPVAVSQASIHIRVVNAWSSFKGIKTQVQLRTSMDGYNYYPIKNFEIAGVNKNFSGEMPRIKSKFFRVIIKRPVGVEGYISAGIGELELLNAGERPLYDPGISDHMEKIASTKFDDERQLFSAGKSDSKPVGTDNIVDLTDKMDTTGHINWDAPAGQWTILRLGYTTTGAINAPATEEGTGLECDKMDTAALNHHFASFPMKLIEAAGRFKGNTFQYLFIDSWECGFQNWTNGFESEFEKRRGYSMLNWIPALCGITVKDQESTEAFFNDYRKTISDLIGERYYAHFSDLCHKEGMQLHAEVIYGGSMYPPLDILNSNKYIDVPMFEFWAGRSEATSLVEYSESPRTDFDKPVLGAIAFNKPVIAAEAYTGYAHYSESPWDLKLFGDRAFCSGINRMVLHSYVHQPSEKIPGMTLGVFASHFNRHNTWWPQVSEWFKYQARVQSVLQKGSIEADILFFTGDRFPEYANYNSFYALPPGYHAAQVNAGLLKSVIVKDHKIFLPNGMSYSLLVLPDDSVMELSTIHKIGEMVLNGAKLYGPRPLRTLSLKNYDENNKALTVESAKIWGKIDGTSITSNEYGSGKAMWGKSLPEVIREIELLPDFESATAEPGKFLFIHKILNGTEIYFVVNQDDKEVPADMVFRVAGKKPEIWDPETGTTYFPAVYREEKNRTHISVRMGPRESLIFIFGNSAPSNHITRVSLNGKVVFPPVNPGDLPVAFPDAYLDNGRMYFIPRTAGDYGFTTRVGNEISCTGVIHEEIKLAKITGAIEFNNFYMEGPKKLAISRLDSWTNNPDPAIRYFSGIAGYTIGFDIPSGSFEPGDSLMLNLGMFKETAKITLNDSLLGYAWHPGYTFGVKGIMKEGTNILKAGVANVYRNRIIGDLRQYGTLNNLWTTSPVDQFLNRNMPLKESGLIGPITLKKINPMEIILE